MITLDIPQLVNAAANRGLRPPPPLTVSEWAERHRIVSAPTPWPGEWRNARTPYLRQIMDCLSPFSPARTIAVMKGSQLGATEAGMNWVGFTIDQSPTSMMVVLPDMGTCKEWSTLRLARLIEATPCLQGKILPAAQRDSGNTMLSKKFPGGFLKLTWASSAARMRSTPAANLLLDEVDEFEGDVDGQGDPVTILKRRFTNFPRGKMLMISTPTGKAGSRIEREFKDGDQRYFFVPCPFCGFHQRLAAHQFNWEPKRYDAVVFNCVCCSAPIPGQYKAQMLSRGVWVATSERPGLVQEGFATLDDVSAQLRKMETERFVSFHLSARYSPPGCYSWSDMARDKDQADQDIGKLKVFVNQVEGKTWHEKGIKSNPKRLYEKAEIEKLEPGIVPKGALFLTAYVDVQDDWLALEVKAWGPGWENWSVYYAEIRAQREVAGGKYVTCRANEPELWQKLDNLLTMEWPCEGGGFMPIWCTGIDSGYAGSNAGMRDAVYAYCAGKRQPDYWGKGQARVPYPRPGAGGKNTTGVVVPTKGGPSSEKAIAAITDTDAARRHANLRLITLGTIYLKDQVLNALRLEYPTDGKFPPGYCHYTPQDIRFFEELCNETRVVKPSGIEYRREGRNEPFDTAVGNLAMAELCGIRVMQAGDWRNLAKRREESAQVAEIVEAPTAAVNNPKHPGWFPPRREGSWFQR